MIAWATDKKYCKVRSNERTGGGGMDGKNISRWGHEEKGRIDKGAEMTKWG